MQLRDGEGIPFPEHHLPVDDAIPGNFVPLIGNTVDDDEIVMLRVVLSKNIQV
jgi:hypothetical protein